MIKARIDGREFTIAEGMSVREAALQSGIYIPGLCSHPELDAFKPFAWSESVWQRELKIENCKLQIESDSAAAQSAIFNLQSSIDFPHCNLCLVEIGGEVVRSCDAIVTDGLQVSTTPPTVLKARHESLKKIFAHHPHACLTCAQREGCDCVQCSLGVPVEQRCCELLGRCEIGKVAQFIGIPADTPKYVHLGRPTIESEPLFIRDYELCVSCLRCVSICRDVRQVDALGVVFADEMVWVGTLRGATLPEADCRFCGACVEVCPTGALRDKRGFAPLVNGKAPCQASCPLQIDVPGYLELIAGGDEVAALELIREQAVLPGVLGYACFHPCEDDCRRRAIDSAASICRLKRYVSDAVGDALPEVEKPPSNGRKVAVIGGGPAGLAAAAELLRAGCEATLIERDKKLGGMLRQALPDYRLPDNVIDRDLGYFEKLGLKTRTGVDVGKDLSLDDVCEDFDAVVLAAGLPNPLPLNVEGVSLRGVESGIEFLAAASAGECGRLTGRTMVIGGGNVAIDSARVVLRLGASEVTVVCLESPAEMPAFAGEVEEAIDEGVVIRNRWGVLKFNGEGGAVAGVVLQSCTRVFDEQGRFDPKFNPAITETVKVDRVIVAIGQRSDRRWTPDLDSPRGVFKAGDFQTGPSSIVHAMADGKKAAARVLEYLQCSPSGTGAGGEKRRGMAERDCSPHLGRERGFLERSRVQPDIKPPAERLTSLEPYESSLTSAQAQSEAARCLRCQLRARIKPVALPPDPWLVFDASLLGVAPESEGVLVLADSDKNPARIAGALNIGKLIAELIEDGTQAAYCRWEIDPMYTKRESEMLQAHLKAFGSLPGSDELDDLF